jgi:hypothetical protein
MHEAVVGAVYWEQRAKYLICYDEQTIILEHNPASQTTSSIDAILNTGQGHSRKGFMTNCARARVYVCGLDFTRQ